MFYLALVLFSEKSLGDYDCCICEFPSHYELKLQYDGDPIHTGILPSLNHNSIRIQQDCLINTLLLVVSFYFMVLVAFNRSLRLVRVHKVCSLRSTNY